MMVVNDLAQVLWDALGPPSDDSGPLPPSDEIQAYADGYITMLSGGLINHVSGTVNAIGSPGLPVTNGTAIGGLIASIISSIMYDIVSLVIIGAPELSNENAAIATYLMASGLVNFSSGNIGGTCTATQVSPGILAGGYGQQGQITLLVGAALAALLPSMAGPLQVPFYVALVSYTMDNAEITYIIGTVVGAFVAGGGAMTGGLANGGTIA